MKANTIYHIVNWGCCVVAIVASFIVGSPWSLAIMSTQVALCIGLVVGHWCALLWVREQDNARDQRMRDRVGGTGFRS